MKCNPAIEPSTSWAQIHSWRQKYRHVFPDVRKLPIVPSLHEWLIAHIKATAPTLGRQLRLLDVGAGPRLLWPKLAPVATLIEYKSHDVDRSLPHDFYDTSEIKDQFDLVVNAEVIEHLDVAGKLSLVQELFRLTAPGGWLALTTPNAQHPTVFWRDCTHVAPIHYYDLAGMLARAGYSRIAIYRVAKMTWRKRLTAWRYRALLKLLHCDFAQSILAVAQRPAPPSYAHNSSLSRAT
ncbi:MAG: class I SAM-dependent methyltransferase [bacterium]|nr:class I SAM-dependent methyltransferase [bacterium]